MTHLLSAWPLWSAFTHITRCTSPCRVSKELSSQAELTPHVGQFCHCADQFELGGIRRALTSVAFVAGQVALSGMLHYYAKRSDSDTSELDRLKLPAIEVRIQSTSSTSGTRRLGHRAKAEKAPLRATTGCRGRTCKGEHTMTIAYSTGHCFTQASFLPPPLSNAAKGCISIHETRRFVFGVVCAWHFSQNT